MKPIVFLLIAFSFSANATAQPYFSHEAAAKAKLDMEVWR
jgi:hypothetical protein